MKLFYSGTYKVKHEFINQSNALEILKDDIRTKIVGNVEDTVYASDGVVIKNNSNVIYVGGFYYEKHHDGKTVCESVVIEELKQIDKCDIVVANLMKYSAIATVTEIIYAAMKNKRIVIFCDPDITNYDVTGEYWFPIITAKQLSSNIEVKYIKDENEIIKYIHSLGKKN